MNTVVSFEDRVKEKLKSSIADLLPEDKLDAIVRATFQEFTTKDLPSLIKAELSAKYREVIVEEFRKPEWQATWNNGKQSAAPALKDLLVEAAPVVLASMLGGAMQTVLYDFQTKLRNQRLY